VGPRSSTQEEKDEEDTQMNAMNALPALYVSSRFVAAPQRYVGAVDPSNPRLVAAAQALYDSLNTNGCTNGFDQTTKDFQAAWIAAGGTLPQDTGGRSPIDGYYGPNTAGALRQLYPDAVAGCVGAAPGPSPSPGPTPLTVLPGTNWLSISSISTTMAQHPWLTALFLGAAVAVTYVNWKKTKRRHSGSRRKARRPVRRRARARRVRRGRRRRR
jgi:hypothetical protein